MTLQLTVSTDKVIAVAGVAGELRDRFGDDYLAGMWKKDIHKQLCWRALQTREGARKRGDIYLAPSWSWLSVDALVWPDETYHQTDGHMVIYYTDVLQASVKARDPSGLHSFESGSLTVRGIAMWASVDDLQPVSTLIRVTAADQEKSAAFTEALTEHEADFHFFWDESTHKELADAVMLKNLKSAGHSKVLLLFCHIVYAKSSSQDNAGVPPLPWLRHKPRLHSDATTYSPEDLAGLVLVPNGSGNFTRVAKFTKTKGGTVPELVARRLGLEPGIDVAGKMELDDPRLSDLVQTVTVV